jgi:hypothetical protein
VEVNCDIQQRRGACVSAGRIVQRHVWCLGVINSSSTMAWRWSIEDLEDGAGGPRTSALAGTSLRRDMSERSIMRSRLSSFELPICAVADRLISPATESRQRLRAGPTGRQTCEASLRRDHHQRVAAAVSRAQRAHTQGVRRGCVAPLRSALASTGAGFVASAAHDLELAENRQ